MPEAAAATGRSPRELAERIGADTAELRLILRQEVERDLEHARNGSLGAVFDHVGIAVSDLAAPERFYRTVLSVLGVEPTPSWSSGTTSPSARRTASIP